uniref:Transmembrane 9 superfamily member n=1 Tax=Albugo laibachii Nc14 TaxID=890382 RepID=F0WEJ2_9STRA|nr:endomembrane protein 70like protein putative [Albugo laibachii Nc14]CCA22874.1 endomembrane protein 70like protein putative [Albugo laibachii Nc14]|eukprot:CCA22874.1 endomembrane protein 70like protein putative [Albugo laibachii Nc14]
MDDHSYRIGDNVVIWVNKIGPYNNPQETYTYNSLPFCKPLGMEEPEAHALGIGEILEGNELFNSGQITRFAIDTEKTTLCSQILSDADALKFAAAVDEHYWYQLSVDDLPVWGLVGKIMKPEDKPELLEEIPVGTRVLYTHKKFSISYNGEHIIHVNLTYSERPTAITPNQKVEFTYEVRWATTDITFEDRFDRFLEDEFFEHQIHWFSIFNSFMMVIFLCGLVALILLRTLRNDYARIAEEDAEELMLESTSSLLRDDPNAGWKLLHGDVFRAPPYLLLFSALIGTGSQLLVLSLSVMIIAAISSLYKQPGGIVSAGLTVYALSSLTNGYASGAFYHQFFYPRVSKDWIRAMCLSSALLPIVIFISVFFINALAVAYGTTYAIPFVTIVQVILIWFFVSCPLAVLGTILGRHGVAKSGFPCRINKFPREIPSARWYYRPSSLIWMTGILPFGSIFIEMYFIFASFWNYKFYYVYGFMLLVFTILLVVTLCVTIVCTYVSLNAENYKWHWTSFAAGGSIAIYVFLYSIYFYFYKTNMSGFLQTYFYFGYMSLFCFAFFLMCGTVGFLGSSAFTRRIYRNIKCE